LTVIRSIFIILFIFTEAYGAFPQEDIIEDQDLKYFNDFVTDHFFCDNFAYTLFGDKPVSLGGHFLELPEANRIFLDFPSIYWKRWEVWKKYAEHFLMKNYLLFEQDAGENRKFIFFINKQAFVLCVKRHQAIFDRELGKKVQGEELLVEFAEGKTPLWKNELLLGILLGYGEHNARLFAKRAKIEGLSLLFGDIFPNEYRMIDKHLNFFEEGKVTFVADLHHPETAVLKKKYQKSTQKIAENYALRDFLGVTLQKLMQ